MGFLNGIEGKWKSIGPMSDIDKKQHFNTIKLYSSRVIIQLYIMLAIRLCPSVRPSVRPSRANISMKMKRNEMKS